MQKHILAGAIAFCLGFFTVAAGALFSAPATTETEIEALVRQVEAGNFLARVEAGRKLASIGSPAVPRLVEMVEGPAGGARLTAVLALGQINDSRAGPALHRLFAEIGNPSRERAAAAATLGRLGYAPAGDSLLAALDEDSNTIQSVSAIALGMIGHDEAVPPLAELARSGSEQVSRSALRALESMGEQSVERLEGMLESGSHREQLLSLEIFRRLNTRESVAALEGALAHENGYLRLTAAFFLSEMGNGAGLPVALEGLESPDPKVRAMAARVLENLEK